MEDPQKIREAGSAGKLYPADALTLEREISLLLESAPPVDVPNAIKAIIVPHDGYMYSGGVAARAYRQIMDQNIKRVVVIAPSHYDSFSFISIFGGNAYRTPLGDLPVDKEIASDLQDFHEEIQFSFTGHSPAENSLEVQLPFLQYIFGKIKIVPIALGLQSQTQIDILSEALSMALPPQESLIIASTDLSHHHPDAEARSLDQIARMDIENYNEDKLWDDIASHRTEMCGYGAAISAMKTARSFGAKTTRVLIYRNSGDITGDRNKVVGYLSAVIY
ncbi:MAG: AmmeMemoRadiSam system protein B [Calditrichia bacterium]